MKNRHRLGCAVLGALVLTGCASVPRTVDESPAAILRCDAHDPASVECAMRAAMLEATLAVRSHPDRAWSLRGARAREDEQVRG